MSCCCEPAHHGCPDAQKEEKERKVLLVRLGLSAVLLAASLALPLPESIKALLALLSWLAAGYDVAAEAVEKLLKGLLLDEMFLMTVASAGAFVLGEFAEGAAVVLLFQIGEFFQDAAVDKSRDSIVDLMDIRPEEAYVEADGKIEKRLPREVRPGEIIVVKPGEKIPLDGVITEGESLLNTVALTGESVPRKAAAGDEVISGCVNLESVLRILVTRDYENSAVTRILELVEHAGEHKSRADALITRFARIYTPSVVAAALLLAAVPPLIWGNFSQWLHRALTFLVISCPCALVISVPLTFFSGIGSASKKGILVKGANFLEALACPGIAAFDKTGTLTRGVFRVTKAVPCGIEQEKLLSLAAAAEAFSNHPIALSLRQACEGKKLPPARDIREIAGQGVIAHAEGKQIAVGNEKMMKALGVPYVPCPDAGTVVYVSAEEEYLGCIVISDEIKPEAGEAVMSLQKLGVRRTVMLTGDSESAARQAAREAGIAEIHGSLLPEEKVAWLEKLLGEKQKGETLLFVGDGVNDAPVLALADVGIAMGALGSDAAIEAADVVLMDDDPRKIAKAVSIARKTRKIVRQNIIFSLLVKILVMVLGAAGVSSLWLAVFADVGVCILAVLNALRAMK